MLDERTEVAVGSIWHEDCDPYLTMVFLRDTMNRGGKLSSLQAAMEREEREETERILDSDCDEDCEPDCDEHTPSLYWSDGTETLGALGLTDDESRDLERNGYVYLAR